MRQFCKFVCMWVGSTFHWQAGFKAGGQLGRHSLYRKRPNELFMNANDINCPTRKVKCFNLSPKIVRQHYHFDGVRSDPLCLISTNPGLFLYIFVLFKSQFTLNLKKLRCCAWDSNPLPQDDRCRRIQILFAGQLNASWSVALV